MDMEDQDDWIRDIIGLLFIICSIVFVGSLIMLSLIINESIKDREDAKDFCNSIGMQYDAVDNSRVCYTDDGDTRYIIKIIYVDGKYRLLKSGEKYL